MPGPTRGPLPIGSDPLTALEEREDGYDRHDLQFDPLSPSELAVLELLPSELSQTPFRNFVDVLGSRSGAWEDGGEDSSRAAELGGVRVREAPGRSVAWSRRDRHPSVGGCGFDLPA